jgi:predicted O-methyltransferase YrrM
MTAGKAFRKYGISLKEGRLLFRLANYHKPLSILTVGSSMGFVPLCLTGYASAARCITLEENGDFAEMAMNLVKQKTAASIEICFGEYEKQIITALEKPGRIDCLYLGKAVDIQTQENVFAQCIPRFHEESICIVEGIHASPARKQWWKMLCRHPKVTVSIDLSMLGILFFHPRLHRRTYKGVVY